MNGVFIVPTGYGAEIGGHSGDASPAAKLIAGLCDKLIVHPNVVNASDINEMTENMLYVEGSILDRFFSGAISLREVSSNEILVAVNGKASVDVINAVSAARVTIGAKIEIVELETPITMKAVISNGIASGEIEGVFHAVQQVRDIGFDVLVVHTPIEYDKDLALEYLRGNGGINLWGGVEAKLSKQMSEALSRPVVHAPAESAETAAVWREFKEAVDPRKAAEVVSICYLHCCLKGAHRAPQMVARQSGRRIWSRDDIDFLITPQGLWGHPHVACKSQGVPIISVAQNTVESRAPIMGNAVCAENYLEAAGIVAAMKAGVSIESVLRPLPATRIVS